MVLKCRQILNNHFTLFIIAKNTNHQYLDKYPQVLLKYDIHGFSRNTWKNLRIFNISLRFCILHSKNRLLTFKQSLSLLKDFLFKIFMREDSLTVKGLWFQMLSKYFLWSGTEILCHTKEI